MNAPAAGWNPDPTGRHEYRYWDGSSWTDDVSDNGLTAVDPVGGGASPGGDPTAAVDTTQRYDTPAGPQSGGYPAQPGPQGAPSGGYPVQPGPQGPPSGGYPPQAGPYGPSYGSGQLPPAQPARSGPPTGLIVGLAAVAIALIVGLVVVLGGDDGGDDDDTATGTTETTADVTSDTTESSGTGLGDEGLVDLIATSMELQADGLITREQAECAAQAMVDHFGADTLLEMSTSGENPFDDVSTEDQTALINLMTECIPADVLVDIGMSAGG